MLDLNLDSFHVSVDEGSVKNVGPATKSVTAKLFGVDNAAARELGDKRVKLVFEDEDGNEVQVALFPEDATAVREDLADLVEESRVFE